MSSLAAGALARKRQEAAANESTQTGNSPGLKTYVDTLAALVPAEVLAAHAAILSFTTKTMQSRTGQNAATITEQGTLKIAFWALCILSVMFYIAGFQKRTAGLPAILGALVPPLAFVGWTMAQHVTAFDAVWPHTAEATRSLIVVLGAVVLGLVATALPLAANKAPAK